VAGKVELLLYRFHHFSLCLHCKKRPLVLLPIPLILKARPIIYAFDVDIRRKEVELLLPSPELLPGKRVVSSQQQITLNMK